MGRTLLTEHEAATVLQAAARGRLQRKIAATAPPRKKVEHGKVATMMHRLQANAVPLQLGIVLALLWANLHPDSYERILGTRADTIRLWPGANLFGHPLTIHYLINDGFMVLFFGIAAKEVTESCLPGGSLNPPSKALSPLVATIGGVGGPILVYLLMTHLFWSAGAFANHTTTDTLGAGDDLHIGHHRQLAAVAATTAAAGNSSLRPVTYAEIAHGWGVPTATDISLAWVVAAQVFPLRHPAIDFLLLLAVADDAIGLVIIATVYVDPLHPVEPVWMLLLAVAVAVAASLRRLSLQHWMWYLLLAGLPAWIGLSKARLHPALALCFVVPAMPSKPPLDRPNQLPTLQAFEHSLKGVVDFGLFFFTLANAGVSLRGGGGPLTVCILGALVVGKIVGIVCLVLLASRMGCAPLNTKIHSADVAMVASTASVGLTVALFVAGEAFPDATLQSEAKFGALLSGLMGLLCLGVSRTPSLAHASTVGSDMAAAMGAELGERYRQGGHLAHRYGVFQRHQLRAGANALPAHPDMLHHPKLFDHGRAQAHWRDAKKGTMQASGFVGFLRAETTKHTKERHEKASGLSEVTV